MDVIREIAADVHVVQECAETSELRAAPGVAAMWSPAYSDATKGVGVFCRNGWTLAPIESDPAIPWVLPVDLYHSATEERVTLFAVWTNRRPGRPSYAGQFASFLDSYASLLQSGPCIVAGDLNASIQGPSKVPHARNLQRAAELGLVSAYHHANGHEHGSEPEMTLKWIGPGRREYFYHCDFIFLSRQLAPGTACAVMNTFDWKPSVSDHQPVVVDIPSR